MAIGRTNSSGVAKYTHPSYTPKASGLYKVTVDASGHVSAATAVTKSDITALGIPDSDTNTTYSAMTGATSSAAGASGLVPAPAAGKQASFLRGDGTWVVPTNTTYSNATTSAAGLMSASDKSKLDGIATGANKTTVDSALSDTSTNPVQNKVINTALGNKADASSLSNYLPLSGGTLTGDLTTKLVEVGGSIYPTAALIRNLGTVALPWASIYGKSYQIYGEAQKSYGGLSAATVGTADTNGISRLTLGNNTAAGTASNASGAVRVYGTGTRYTDIVPGSQSANNTLTLPTSTGTLATTADITAAIGNAIAASY